MTREMTAAEYQRLAGKRHRGRARTRPRRAGEMTQIERDWEAQLELRRAAGLLVRIDYEPERLRLAKDTTYQPDFRVVMADGEVVFFEVKGPHAWEDAIVKLRVAAELHPYRFVMVTRDKVTRAWREEEI